MFPFLSYQLTIAVRLKRCNLKRTYTGSNRSQLATFSYVTIAILLQLLLVQGWILVQQFQHSPSIEWGTSEFQASRVQHHVSDRWQGVPLQTQFLKPRKSNESNWEKQKVHWVSPSGLRGLSCIKRSSVIFVKQKGRKVSLSHLCYLILSISLLYGFMQYVLRVQTIFRPFSGFTFIDSSKRAPKYKSHVCKL